MIGSEFYGNKYIIYDIGAILTNLPVLLFDDAD